MSRAGRTEVETLFREHRPTIYRLCLAITGSHDAAEDATQEACGRIFRSNGQLAEVDNLRAWTRTVAVRCALDVAAKRRHDTIPEEMAAKSPDPDETMAVAQTLARLTPEHRTVLALALFERLSYEEIAETLAIPVGSVASRLHAAKARFRELWEEA